MLLSNVFILARVFRVAWFFQSAPSGRLAHRYAQSGESHPPLMKKEMENEV